MEGLITFLIWVGYFSVAWGLCAAAFFWYQEKKAPDHEKIALRRAKRRAFFGPAAFLAFMYLFQLFYRLLDNILRG